MTVEAFFTSGHVADLLLFVMAMEGALLAWRHSATGAGHARGLGKIFWALAPGACLVLALRAALTGAGWQWIAIALSAAGGAHLVDLWYRSRP